MSKELKILKNTGSRGIDLSITKHCGTEGDYFQITGEMEEGRIGYVQLNKKDIEDLVLETKENEFIKFPKIYRVSRPCIISEKIDGTNAQIEITEKGDFLIGARKSWITPEDDNHGFAKWATKNKEELLGLGVGKHFGEWWGQGIQRTYELKEKRFSLFNTYRWSDDAVRPKCCEVVPVLYEGIFDTAIVDECVEKLRSGGSIAAPGFMRPEGVVCFHVQGNFGLKKTLEKDDEHKGNK